jgi:hypothetical protein
MLAFSKMLKQINNKTARIKFLGKGISSKTGNEKECLIAELKREKELLELMKSTYGDIVFHKGRTRHEKNCMKFLKWKKLNKK